MSYLLDTNVFMSAKNLHYGLDFCPAFSYWLRNFNTVETLEIWEQVYNPAFNYGGFATIKNHVGARRLEGKRP